MVSFGRFYLWAICLFAQTSVAQNAPETTKEAKLLHARAELSYWQNWASIGGTYYGPTVASLGVVVAAYIATKSNSDSCSTNIDIVEKSSKRDYRATDVEAMTNGLANEGYLPFGEWVDYKNGTQTFDGYFSNGEFRIENPYIRGNYTGALFAVEGGSSGNLYQRTIWSHKKFALEYHSHTGTCKTRLTKKQLEKAAKAQIENMSDYEYSCCCWTYTGGHGWYGEVKLMDVDSGDVFSGSCFDRTCNAT
ncbi:hypothetical protein N7448_001897 [Penicillium atrosanguineum]|uniref:Uncharacterized protein n=1 Tax=Penicillium atrosanguineum TaxID=1132637 RepID=A0A9W9HM93_9EURO|nr:Aldo/keto reductase subgroup [Penicillium atrosanguineum]KAJ5133074.1 hypothetical protein N7526_004439 [Penicillium atrosanguineum]KAJ5150319.1 hypothetical protein N7448_001897 [Penicillium atrosanguineum]KAJ5305635.1 Aldo/keto reductase subgroup [Penicillium atrosanguineum]KAJ5325097.1 hypothetical protein N7476_003697 [Penicillium atrosanguineum]